MYVDWYEEHNDDTRFLLSTEKESVSVVYQTFIEAGATVRIDKYRDNDDEDSCYPIEVNPEDLKDSDNEFFYVFSVQLYNSNLTFKKFNELTKKWDCDFNSELLEEYESRWGL